MKDTRVLITEKEYAILNKAKIYFNMWSRKRALSRVLEEFERVHNL